MTLTGLKVFAVTALLTAAGAVSGNSGQDPTLQEIAGYREWNRLTAKPIRDKYVIDGGFD